MFRLAFLPVVLLLSLLGLGPASAQHQHNSHHHSPYAGEEDREIKSLSAEDIAELERGGGWGFAKAAELNGYPGPSHILAMKEEIGLSSAQAAKIEAIFQEMQAKAIEGGKRLIALEKKLEDAFRNRTVTTETLMPMLAQIAETRQKLRGVHLTAHLQAEPVLTGEQIAAYDKLRGYK